MIEVIGIIVGIFSIIIGIPAFFTHLKKKALRKNLSNIFNRSTIEMKILSYIWFFPTIKNQESWCVKENLVMQGKLEEAKKQIGIGVAIFSTEFALKYLENISDGKIDRCINHYIEQTQINEPYLVTVEKIDPIYGTLKKIPDIRHSIALAIILTKTKKYPNYLKSYIKYVIENQNVDGGWAGDKKDITSEIFSCLYSIELLILNKEKKYLVNINNAIECLINCQSNNSNLWRSTKLKEDTITDFIITTAFVLNRLLQYKIEEYNEKWKILIIDIVNSLIAETKKNEWKTIEYYHKFRLESRISLVLYNSIKYNYLDSITKEKATAFINNWKISAKKTMKNISYEDFDLATALFMAEPFLGSKQIIKTVGKFK